MKRLFTIFSVLLLSVFLVACKSDNKDDSVANKINVYYLDAKTSGLVSESYNLLGTKTKDQIIELLYMLQKTPENAVYKTALPVDADVSYSLDNTGCLIVDFNSSYSELSKVADILCRAAVVKTLCQLPEVESVQFSVEKQLLQDLDGVVKPMKVKDFIDYTAADATYKAKLYFANKKGDKLIAYALKVDYTGAEPIEELVIQQLIKGPKLNDGSNKIEVYPTVPKGTRLLNITKADGICTVNFNDKFLDKLSDINENVAIYSIVDSLIVLPDINKVQFAINGKIRKYNWENIDFSSTFESDLDLIQNPE